MSLKHYDLFTAFNRVDAAHLAAGVEPQLRLDLRPISGEMHPKTAEVRVIIGAMDNGITGAFCNIRSALLVSKYERNFPDWALSTTGMIRSLSADFPCFPHDSALDRWLVQEQLRHKNNELIFDRAELHRWFKAKGTGFKSNYEFVSDQKMVEPGANAPTVNDVQPTEAPEKPLGTTERNTLLTIIAALCKEAKIDIKTPSKAGDLIQSLTNLMGTPVAKRTIEEHLKKIPDALVTRMK